MIPIETWFIPFDILMIVCTTLVIILAVLFLSVIIVNKTCHTVPMMLVANSCLTALLFGCSLFTSCIFTLEHDLKQIEYEDSLCIVRAYFLYASAAIINDSFLIQAVYRYVTVVYPTAFMFTGEIIYNIDNQICQIPIRLSFPMMYTVFYVYAIPISMIMFIYFKLVRYVREMGKRLTPVNTLFRAQRELKIVQRTVILTSILLILGFPYASFIFMSIFISPPKYRFRIAYIFIDVSLAFVMIVLFQFTEPLKASMMKKIKRQPNRVVATIT
jgi:hypothetical protein